VIWIEGVFEGVAGVGGVWSLSVSSRESGTWILKGEEVVVHNVITLLVSDGVSLELEQ